MGKIIQCYRIIAHAGGAAGEGAEVLCNLQTALFRNQSVTVQFRKVNFGPVDLLAVIGAKEWTVPINQKKFKRCVLHQEDVSTG